VDEDTDQDTDGDGEQTDEQEGDVNDAQQSNGAMAAIFNTDSGEIGILYIVIIAVVVLLLITCIAFCVYKRRNDAKLKKMGQEMREIKGIHTMHTIISSASHEGGIGRVSSVSSIDLSPSAAALAMTATPTAGEARVSQVEMKQVHLPPPLPPVQNAFNVTAGIALPGGYGADIARGNTENIAMNADLPDEPDDSDGQSDIDDAQDFYARPSQVTRY